MVCERSTWPPSVELEGLPVSVPEPLDEAGGAFDVGEKKGDRAARQRCHSGAYLIKPVVYNLCNRAGAFKGGRRTGRPERATGAGRTGGAVSLVTRVLVTLIEEV